MIYCEMTCNNCLIVGCVIMVVCCKCYSRNMESLKNIRSIEMATRTCPTIDGSPNQLDFSMSMIDKSGDVYSDSIPIDSATTSAQLEAIVSAYQAGTQCSIFSATKTERYVGVEDASNADTSQRNSSRQGVNIAMKNLTTRNTISPRWVAPQPVLMQGDLDIPEIEGSAQFTAFFIAYQAVLTGYEIVSAQYTERRERSNNPKIKI